MRKQKYVTSLWLCCVLLTSVMADTCPYKECQCAEPVILCQRLGLTSFPTLDGLPTSGFTTLAVDNNQITSIPAKGLPFNLTDLSISQNPIASIDEDAFEGSTSTLDSLTFSEARFTRIPDAFLQLTALKYFIVYNTNILDWNDDAMRNIGKTVLSIYLQNVGLTAWPTWIQYFSQLTELTLDDTTISSIPDDALDLLVNSLHGLSINNGSLTAIPKAFSKLIALESLNLENNNIVDVTFIPHLSNLSSLSLDHNKISDANHLSNALRPFADSLRAIELENNQLTAIPDVSFLKKIGSLGFRYNQISDANSGSVPPGIYELDLTYNLLPAIPSLWAHLLSVSTLALSYNSITKLQGIYIHNTTYEVDLGHNLITELTDTSFPPKCNIGAAYFNANPISSISAQAFKNLPKLIILNLSGTRLTRLPLQLAFLTSLMTLDMSDSTYLVCTCAEKSLASWIGSLVEIDEENLPTRLKKKPISQELLTCGTTTSLENKITSTCCL